jgi:hypothetical protein
MLSLPEPHRQRHENTTARNKNKLKKTPYSMRAGVAKSGRAFLFPEKKPSGKKRVLQERKEGVTEKGDRLKMRKRLKTLVACAKPIP